MLYRNVTTIIIGPTFIFGLAPQVPQGKFPCSCFLLLAVSLVSRDYLLCFSTFPLVNSPLENCLARNSRLRRRFLTNDLKLFVYSKLQNGREFQKLSPDHMSYKNPAPIKLPTTKSGCRSLPHVTIRDVQSWPQLAGASRISQLRQLR